MGALAVFGISNDGLNLTVNLLLLFLVVLWFALIYWTYADAHRRIEDPMLVACATAAALFPFIGTIVYMIVRPPEYLEDRHEREIEVAAAEARLRSLDEQACPHCGFEVEKSFLRCPSCLRRLKAPCSVCGKPLDPRWPYPHRAIVRQPESGPRARRGRFRSKKIPAQAHAQELHCKAPQREVVVPGSALRPASRSYSLTEQHRKYARKGVHVNREVRLLRAPACA